MGKYKHKWQSLGDGKSQCTDCSTVRTWYKGTATYRGRDGSLFIDCPPCTLPAAELEYLHTQPIFKVKNNFPTGELHATGIFRDKNEKAVGSFLVQISGDRLSGIEPQYYVEVVQRVLDELKEKIKKPGE